MSFLTAEWRKLILVNYQVDEALLKPYLPNKTELDFWNGATYASLVGFKFVNTRLLGLKIPFHTDFEEVNLRFYVKFKDGDDYKRGVVFIKEIVPRSALTFVANTIYRERYVTMPMQHEWQEDQQKRKVMYSWISKKQPQSLWVEAALESEPILKGTEAGFITEHYWGYTQVSAEKTYEYEVTHPTWEQYQVLNYQVDVDFGLVYGDRFSFLNKQSPTSVILAEGSNITVEGKRNV